MQLQRAGLRRRHQGFDAVELDEALAVARDLDLCDQGVTCPWRCGGRPRICSGRPCPEIEYAGFTGDGSIAERSLFGLGLDLAYAEKLGRLFEQDAIVWVSADGAPQLILPS